MPRRFKFNLEPALSVRRIDEDKRKRAFGEASRRVEEQARRIEAIERHQDAAREAFAKTRAGGIDITQLRLEEGWRVGLDRRLRRESAELVKRLQVREERRGAFVEARKKVRVLERLRERRLAEYRREAEREEQKIIDENAVTQFVRKEPA